MLVSAVSVLLQAICGLLSGEKAIGAVLMADVVLRAVCSCSSIFICGQCNDGNAFLYAWVYVQEQAFVCCKNEISSIAGVNIIFGDFAGYVYEWSSEYVCGSFWQFRESQHTPFLSARMRRDADDSFVVCCNPQKLSCRNQMCQFPA